MKLNRYLYFEYPCTIILVYDIYTNILLICVHNLDIYKIQRYYMDIYILNTLIIDIHLDIIVYRLSHTFDI